MVSRSHLPASSGFTFSAYRPALWLILALWGVGLWDLATHISGNPETAVWGLYARPVFAVLVVYASFFFVWLAAFALPQAPAWTRAALGYVQRRTWLALPALALLCLVGWSIFAWPEWLEYPALSVVVLLGCVLSGAVLVLHGWRTSTGQRWRTSTGQRWRTLVLALVSLVLLVELTAQALAWSGHLPGTHRLDGAYAPQARVYQDAEGLGNGRANDFGWYYPDFALAEDSHRILVLGDTFVQALQIDRDEHLGVQLQTLINDGASPDQPPVEVLALGYPGFGPGLYLNIEMLAYAIDAFEPDQVIALVHLGNDLVNGTAPTPHGIYFAVGEGGNVTIHPDNFTLWHNLAHYTITGYEPRSPIRTMDSYILTPKLWAGLGRDGGDTAVAASADPYDIPGVQGRVTRFGARRGDHTVIESIALEATPGRSNFLFERAGSADAEAATAITTALIDTFYDFTKAQGIDFHVVTIPVFPPAFYTEFADENWQPELGEHDLFLPERRLAAFAAEEGVPLLSTGQQMADASLSTAQIQSLYFAGGTGHFTPAGHAHMARAIYDCFYAFVNASAKPGRTEEMPHCITN